MEKQAGEHLDFIAMHMMGQSPRRPDTVLRGPRYQRDPQRAWEELIELSDAVERRVVEIEQATKKPIAITEGHLSLSPHNANPILSEWLSAVYHARSMNIYQRHGDRIRIATAADFNGNRWTVSAVTIPTPGGKSYLMPVASIARLFKRHNGTHGIAVKSAPAGLDIAASRAGGKLYLHVANTQYSRAVEATLPSASGKVYEIAPDDLRAFVNADQPDTFKPREHEVRSRTWRFPAGSVSAVELDL
jgi:hypothetical protein